MATKGSRDTRKKVRYGGEAVERGNGGETHQTAAPDGRPV